MFSTKDDIGVRYAPSVDTAPTLKDKAKWYWNFFTIKTDWIDKGIFIYLFLFGFPLAIIDDLISRNWYDAFAYSMVWFIVWQFIKWRAYAVRNSRLWNEAVNRPPAVLTNVDGEVLKAEIRRRYNEGLL